MEKLKLDIGAIGETSQRFLLPALAAAPVGELTLQRLHDGILAKLSGPEGRLLRALIAAYPDSMSGEDLAAAAGYSASSTSFTNPRGRLKELGLVRYPAKGTVVALPVLFPESLS
jgi:hypothetical protein